jgi:ribosomal protein L40E
MPEILTESFCERCGTRYTFEAQVPKKSSLGKLRTLSKGFKNYVLSDETTLEEAFADARHDEEREITGHQLDAFHKAFNFCMSCRQYTCANCWNEVENRCLSCAPHLGQEILPPAFPHLQSALGLSTTAALGNGHPDQVPSTELAWPTADFQASAVAEEAVAPDESLDVDTAARLASLLGTTAPVAEPPVEAAPEDVADAAALAEAEAMTEAEAYAEPEAEAETYAEPEAEAYPEPFGEAEAQEYGEADAAAEPTAAIEAVEYGLETEPVFEVEAAAHAEGLEALPAVEPETLAESDISDVERAVADANRIAAERAAAAAQRTSSIFGKFRAGRDGAVEPAVEAAAIPEAEPEPVTGLPSADLEAQAEPEAEAVISAIDVEAEPEIEPVEAYAIEPEFEPATEQLLETEPEIEPAAASAAPVETEPAPTLHEPPAEPVFPPPARPAIDRVEQPAWQVVAPETAPAPPNGGPVVQPTMPAAATADGVPRPGEQIAAEPPQWPSEPQWPTEAAWPSHQASFQPTRSPINQAPPPIQAQWPPVDTRTVGAHQSDGMWAASSRELLVNRAETGVQACVSCGLPLSATARFCRRCGTQQG